MSTLAGPKPISLDAGQRREGRLWWCGAAELTILIGFLYKNILSALALVGEPILTFLAASSYPCCPPI